MNYVTADLHLSHGNIIKYCNRPFLMEEDKAALAKSGGVWHRGNWKGEGSSNWKMSYGAVKLMNDTFINNINATVGEDDTLWVLGDFAYGIRDDYLNVCRAHRGRIKCKNVNLIWGNHDKRNIRDLFSFTTDLVHTEIAGRKITMCHYAMAFWDQSHRGAIQLYGHSHSNGEEWLNRMMPGRRSMDCGIDNAFKLVGSFRPLCIEKECIPWMLARPGHSTHKNPQVGNSPTEEELLHE